MRLLDLLRLIIENLGRRKTRVALTAVGVVIGTAAVVVLVSLGIGLQRNATEQLIGIGDLTVINVSPNYAQVMGGGGGGYGGMVEAFPGGPSYLTPITDQTIRDLAALPNVIDVYPREFLQVGAMLKLGRLEGSSSIIGVPPDYLSEMGYELQSGTADLGKGTAVVGALVSQSFYDPRPRPGQGPPEWPELFDQTLKLILFKYSPEGQETRRTMPIRVTGVLSEMSEDPWAIYMTLDEVSAFNQWATGRRVNRNREGYPNALVKVDDVSHVAEVNDAITGMGYQASSPMPIVQGINSFFLLLQVIFGGVGAIALLVAAIGIANTMAMAILERTREIGLMKAVGATNRDVLGIFLGEAAGIGFIGGVGGMLLGWGAGEVIDVLALSYLAQQAAQTGSLPPAVAVYTPAWLPVFALAFATFIGLISGLYPALRAATLVPVTALKYE